MFKTYLYQFIFMIAKFKIVIKKGCYFCDKLIKWLEENKVNFKSLDYLDPKDFDDPLMKNSTFNSLYCDMSACVESIPLVVKNDEDFYYGELWNLVDNELNEKRAKEIFDLD